MDTARAETAFEIEARETLTDLQRAAACIVESVAPQGGFRVSDLADALGIDTKLAWKLNRIVELDDPYAAGVYVPGSTAARIVVAAARDCGAPKASVDALDAAFMRFEKLQRDHAGDRRTLDTLLAALAGAEKGRNEEQARKAAHQANVALWGVSVTTRLMSFIVRARQDDPDQLEAAHVAGTFGVRRTRPNVPWRIGAFWVETNEGTMPEGTPRGALDPACGPGEPPILSSHTSANVPELVAVQAEPNRVEYRLGGGPIGLQSEFDLVTAERFADAGSRYRAPGDDQLSVGSRNRTPAERVILELTIERSIFGRISPEPMLFGELWGEHPPAELDHPDRMPLHERVAFVGAGLAPFRHRAVPRHRDLMTGVFDLLGWDPAAFDTYRLELTYPPSPTILRMVHPLPSKPKGSR